MRLKNLVYAMAAVMAAFVAWPSVGHCGVVWTDWNSANFGSVAGSAVVGATTVHVTFTGSYGFAQLNGGRYTPGVGPTNQSIDYWAPTSPYISSLVDTSPPNSEIIALDLGGTGTITFSQAVHDPLIALNSWNWNTVDFGVPLELVSLGTGYWGGGTPVFNSAGTGFYGDGEVHGVFRLPGVFTSISFTHTSEYWHGFTVGLGPNAIFANPEPSSALIFAGLVGLAACHRRFRRSKKVA